MCDRKGRGVAMVAFPAPSRSISTAIRVSEVLRSTRALRSGMAGHGTWGPAAVLWPWIVKGLAAVALSASLVACSGSTVVQQGPSDTLRAYARALEQGRVDDA